MKVHHQHGITLHLNYLQIFTVKIQSIVKVIVVVTRRQWGAHSHSKVILTMQWGAHMLTEVILWSIE